MTAQAERLPSWMALARPEARWRPRVSPSGLEWTFILAYGLVSAWNVAYEFGYLMGRWEAKEAPPLSAAEAFQLPLKGGFNDW